MGMCAEPQGGREARLWASPRRVVVVTVLFALLVNVVVELALTGETSGSSAFETAVITGLVGSAIMFFVGRALGAMRDERDWYVAAREAELAKNAALQKRNRDLERFARTLAHDIKSPLTVIVGSAELLRDGTGRLSEAQQRERLDAIADSGFRLTDIVDSLLGVATLDDPKKAVEPIELRVALDRVKARMAPVLASSKVQLELHVADVAVSAVPAWFDEVLLNLLTNAIKYGGRNPRVRVHASRVGDRVHVAVADNGIGLPPGAAESLFKPMARLHPEHAPGHGLGLMLVREFLERMDGAVHAGSPGLDGVGTTFVVVLPAAALPTVPVATEGRSAAPVKLAVLAS